MKVWEETPGPGENPAHTQEDNWSPQGFELGIFLKYT